MFLCSLYVPCTLPCTFLVSIFVCSMFQYCSSPLCDRRKFCWTTLLAFYIHGVRVCVVSTAICLSSVQGIKVSSIKVSSCLGLSIYLSGYLYQGIKVYPSIYQSISIRVSGLSVCLSIYQGISIRVSRFIYLSIRVFRLGYQVYPCVYQSIGVSLSGYQGLSINLENIKCFACIQPSPVF